VARAPRAPRLPRRSPDTLRASSDWVLTAASQVVQNRSV
jgi:hypothetical protein